MQKEDRKKVLNREYFICEIHETVKLDFYQIPNGNLKCFCLPVSIRTMLWKLFVQTIRLHYAPRKYGKNVKSLIFFFIQTSEM